MSTVSYTQDPHGMLRDIGNASHRPLLYMALEATRSSKQPVLELGAGHGSTPYLHRYCLKERRDFVSMESDPRWSVEFADIDGVHFKRFVGSWESMHLERPWSVALVDHAPPERRHVDIERLAPHARIIVIHDSEARSSGYMLEKIWHLFKFRCDIEVDAPYANATAVSNVIDVTAWKGIGFEGYDRRIT